MSEAAGEERFEQAAQLRDALRTIETLQQRQQKMTGTGLGDRDAFGLKIGPAGAVVQVFQVRGGKVIERIELATSRSPIGGCRCRSDRGSGMSEGPGEVGETEILQAALEQFYTDHPAPPEIHLPVELNASETEIIEAWLTDRSEHRVRIVVPKRGEKRGLLDLAARNAQVAYQTRFNETVAAHYDALETLRVVLNLPSIPRRIECFDISTIQGSETVASMVVCEDGRMKRAEYRKFRIRAKRADSNVREGTTRIARSPILDPRPRILDDFASMHEVVLRRYRKVLENGGPFPDLIVIDGGKGQLSAAYAALESLGLANLVAVGIAKKEELLFTREHVEPMALASNSPALLLIQRIRDEAHRFAVTFHRQSRAKRDLRSELDDVAGIGPRRRKALLTAFGSLAACRRATREDSHCGRRREMRRPGAGVFCRAALTGYQGVLHEQGFTIALAKPYVVTDGRRFRLKDHSPNGPRLDEVAGTSAKKYLKTGRREARRAAGQALRAGPLGRAADLPGDGRGGQGRHDQARHVRRSIPQGCQVYSFKAPSSEELDHDFLWRTSKALPERGRIGIFNRSYYEEMLVVRVHPEYPRKPEAAAEARHAADLEGALRGHQRLRALPGAERVRRSASSSSTSRARSSAAGSSSASTSRRRTGSSRCRTSRSARTGASTWRPTRTRSATPRAARALGRRPGGRQEVRPRPSSRPRWSTR